MQDSSISHKARGAQCSITSCHDYLWLSIKAFSPQVVSFHGSNSGRPELCWPALNTIRAVCADVYSYFMLSQSVSWSPSIRAAYCTWTRGERFFCLLATPAYDMIHTIELNEVTKAHKFTSTETVMKHSGWAMRTCRGRWGRYRKRKEDKRNEGTVWCLMEELDYCKTEQNMHITFRKSYLWLWKPSCYNIVLNFEPTEDGYKHWLKLTASPSTFSLEPRWLPTTDSSTATQRCLSGKLGAMKYRDWPGQQEVWGCDSSFST